MRRALLGAAAAAGGARRGAEDLVSGISQDMIQITSNYTGTDIVVFGAIERAAERRRAATSWWWCAAPTSRMTVRRARPGGGRVGQPRRRRASKACPPIIIWPRTAPRGAHRLAARRWRAMASGCRRCIPTAGRQPSRSRALPPGGHALSRAQSAFMPKVPGGIDFLSETLFRTRVPVPAGVTRGQYNVEVYLFRDGEVVSAQSTPLFVDATGLERRLFNLAHDAPLLYGLACVLMAMLLGWISSVLFRRPA